jgi:hypothetical protein
MPFSIDVAEKFLRISQSNKFAPAASLARFSGVALNKRRLATIAKFRLGGAYPALIPTGCWQMSEIE